MIDDLEAGVLRLGDILNPNAAYNLNLLTLFIDNLFTYGSNYVDYRAYWRKQSHRQKRLIGMKNIHIICMNLQA